jgi:DNA-binding beta-propeller fold protein YncE
MATTMERPAGTATKPRPRFARELETPNLRLPPGKRLGAVIAAVYGPNGDLFILHQGNAQGAQPEEAAKGGFLPSLVHLTGDGDYINAWGGPGYIPAVDGVDQWPEGLEGLECDDDGNLWIFGFHAGDNAVLKFSPAGELLLRIGQRGKAGNDDDTQFLDRPTSSYHNTATREVFVTDGYGNHRVISFNADTGEFIRMWGAYGKKPSDLDENSFANPVHKVKAGPDGHIYVADRIKNRIQEFELVPGGARYIREVSVGPGTGLFGAAFDIGFSPDNRYIYVPDGVSFRVWIIDRESFEVLGSTTVHDEYENEGNLPLHYTIVHRFTVEPNGDLLLACVNRGLRRLKYLGVS